MLKWVLLFLLWGPSLLMADEACEKAVEANVSACHGDLVDPAFQRAHKTSPRTNVLVYNLSQSCVTDIAECFDKCGDSRFRDGDKFKQVLKLLRAPLGEKLVSPKTLKCRENLNKYAKKVTQVCEKFKVHQSAAADVSDAKQRILSEHCSSFSTYLEPLVDKNKAIGKASRDKSKSKKKSLGSRSQAPGNALDVGSVDLSSDGLGSSDNLSDNGELLADEPNTRVYAPSPGTPDRRGRRQPPSQRLGGNGKVNKRAEKPGFLTNSPASFQPLGSPAKVKKKSSQRRGSVLKKQKEGLAGTNYHKADKVPDPGSGQALSPVTQQNGVSAAMVQELQQKLMKKVGGRVSVETEESPSSDKGPPEVFNDTKRTFRKFRRNNEFIE